MLTRQGIAVRLTATAIVLGLLVVGTFFGQDDHFPFGPFRMFSTSNELDGRVNEALIEVTTADGVTRDVAIVPENFGLRRAEVEGQRLRFESDPSLLAALAGAYDRLHPDEPAVASITLVHDVYRLHDGRPVETFRETVATWDE